MSAPVTPPPPPAPGDDAASGAAADARLAALVDAPPTQTPEPALTVVRFGVARQQTP